MIRKNLDQVDIYFKDLVKFEEIEEISFVNNDGTILITTNKKNEGQRVIDSIADQMSSVTEILIIDDAEKRIIASPVMLIDSRLGILLITFSNNKYSPQNEIEII